MMQASHQTKRVLGVDGGGSKTTAWIANVLPSDTPCGVELETIGRGTAGPSNPLSVGYETAVSNLATAIGLAIEQSGVDRNSIDVACISLAGVGRPEQKNRIQHWSEEQAIAKRTIVIDDIQPLRFAAMYEQQLSESSEAVSWEDSITLVVGTGSIALGTREGGVTSRCGGWGYLLGDEGSGFWIGLSGLRSVCQSQDRGGEWTPFHRALLDQLGKESESDLVGWVYQSPIPRASIAQLSKIVLEHASRDSQAGQIIKEAVDAMVQLAETTARRLELSHRSFALALSGGILCNNPSIVSQLFYELQLRNIAPQTVQLVRNPIYGPLLIAAQKA